MRSTAAHPVRQNIIRSPSLERQIHALPVDTYRRYCSSGFVDSEGRRKSREFSLNSWVRLCARFLTNGAFYDKDGFRVSNARRGIWALVVEIGLSLQVTAQSYADQMMRYGVSR